MTAVKKMALLGLMLAIPSVSAQAGPMGRLSWRWTTWVSNQGGTSNGQGYSITGPSNLNLYASNQAPAPQPAPAAPVAQPTDSGSPLGTLSLVASNAPAPVPVPTPVPTYSPVVNPTPMVAQAPVMPAAAAATPPSPTYNAYIDLNGGPYLNSSVLTTGGAQAWYNSPTAIQAFGGTPNAQQQASFDQAVLAHVEQTYQLSGMNPSIKLDPNANALHTISVVSNTTNGSDPNAIGMTEVGGNGFSFIDKLASLNLNVNQLEWAVAHNIAHELMHAFGIGEHPDQTGTYIDAASASMSVLTDPNTTFSPTAVALIKATDYGVNVSGTTSGAENLAPGASSQATPVPEPSTILAWGFSLAVAGIAMNRKNRARQAA